MHPILKNTPDNGIGYRFDYFLEDFFDVCYEHMRTNRAKAFAFILFDFEHGNVIDTMKNQGVFTLLDRISGKDLTIFYLNTYEKNMIKKFNDVFVHALSGRKRMPLPAIVFFKVVGNDAEGIEYHRLSNDMHILFSEIKENVERYIGHLNENGPKKHDFLKIWTNKIIGFGAEYAGEKLLDKLTGN